LLTEWFVRKRLLKYIAGFIRNATGVKSASYRCDWMQKRKEGGEVVDDPS
jgi:hypothetical protein